MGHQSFTKGQESRNQTGRWGRTWSDTCLEQSTRQNHLVMLMRRFSNHCPLRIPRRFSCKNWALWCHVAGKVSVSSQFLFSFETDQLTDVTVGQWVVVTYDHLSTGQCCYPRCCSHFLLKLFYILYPQTIPTSPLAEDPSQRQNSGQNLFGLGFFFPHGLQQIFCFCQLMMNLEICTGGKQTLHALLWPLTPWPKLRPCLPGSATTVPVLAPISMTFQRGRRREEDFGGIKTVS